MTDKISRDIEKLRKAETKWIASELSRAIANLGYPVGCGLSLHPRDAKYAANLLFDRYAKMIESAKRAGK